MASKDGHGSLGDAGIVILTVGLICFYGHFCSIVEVVFKVLDPCAEHEVLALHLRCEFFEEFCIFPEVFFGDNDSLFIGLVGDVDKI